MAETIQTVVVDAFRVPTESPESDGTLEWDATTLVTVELVAGGATGLGYTYADGATAQLIQTQLAPAVVGCNPAAIPEIAAKLRRSVRNLGARGIAAMAISAIDVALWDLKARLLEIPLVTLLGEARREVAVYGSGGFTSASVGALQKQLGGWARGGFRAVKMKVGRTPEEDARRVTAAREAVGPNCALFVDANGAYARQQALALAQRFHESGVTWFEEPVSSDDLDGLRWLRGRLPPGMELSAGEYGYVPEDFARLLEGVDVLQADATRCLGITGLLQASALAVTFHAPLSTHCAPALHLHPACALPNLRHVEHFFDHARIEERLFEGVILPVDGVLRPDLSRPGHGLTLRRKDAERFAL